WTNYHANVGGPSVISAWSGPIVTMRNDSFGSSANYQNSNNGKVSVASILDGTSNTAVASEMLVGLQTNQTIRPGNNAMSKRVIFQISGTGKLDSGNGAAALMNYRKCSQIPAGTTALGGSNNRWSGACWAGTHASTLHFNAYNHANTPNGMSCNASGVAYAAAPGGIGDLITANSNHSGGVNVAFCDGSVHFVKNSIAPNIWWALGTRSGGEVISSNAY
ncbi:MAG TPA: DUF1559 domain-containing protein, partial [Isosphaeraceae bacterium]|nr:DUF1559 domain-containing protein [Isosphaeraceae bacterium]